MSCWKCFKYSVILNTLDFTKSQHSNTGPINMFFTKKCNYFSRGTKWDYPFWSQSLESGRFWHFKITFWQKKWIFPNLIFQLHPIITQLILNQFACSLPKTNTTFHQLFKYVKKEEIFSSIRGENSRNIFGPCSTRGTVNSKSSINSMIHF